MSEQQQDAVEIPKWTSPYPSDARENDEKQKQFAEKIRQEEFLINSLRAVATKKEAIKLANQLAGTGKFPAMLGFLTKQDSKPAQTEAQAELSNYFYEKMNPKDEDEALKDAVRITALMYSKESFGQRIANARESLMQRINTLRNRD